ncbi:MAG TPA: hypothetical protein DCY06_07670 [Bacteroidetes bacterium]|nr:hypothetical protein [Bacteroidota bacterium]
MKMITKKCFFLAAFVFLIPLKIFSQFPPAQGPPPVSGEPVIREIPTFIIKNMVNIMLRDSIVPDINANIAAEDPPIGINVSFTLEQRKPFMTETKYTDRPNEKIVTLPFKIDFKLDLSGIPDRHVFQNLNINFSCNNWFTNSGKMQFDLHAERPFLGGPSFTEQAINFFIGNWLTPFIDSKIKSELPGAIRKSFPVELFKPDCNCLSVTAAGAAPTFEDSFIRYQKKLKLKTDLLSVNNTIQISVDNIKRLPAKNLETGSVLYDSSENINVEFYANHSLKTFSVSQITEGQTRAFTDNILTVGRPGKGGTLVLIANVTQANNRRDTRFTVFNSNQKFGNGVQKLIVRKSYFSKPFRLPDGSLSKPTEVLRDAYEITVTIKSGGTEFKR